MARFSYHPQLQAGTTVRLSREESCHLKAQRLYPGSPLFLSDGKGRVFRGTVQQDDGREKLVTVEEQLSMQVPPYRLRVCQAILHNQARMDWLVEKLVELGATEICFFIAHHSVPDISHRKIRRLERIVVEACKQSGRAFFPTLRSFLEWEIFKEFLANENGLVLVCEPAASATLTETLREEKISECSLLIGPEGDFTDREKTELGNINRSVFVKLTNTVLRSETAALYAACLTMSFLEKMDEDCPENFWL